MFRDGSSAALRFSESEKGSRVRLKIKKKKVLKENEFPLTALEIKIRV
jgi:hypothetical protein